MTESLSTRDRILRATAELLAELPEIEEPDSFYDHQLVGLDARLPDGVVIGTVTAVRHEAQDLLVVRRAEGGEALIPFVAARRVADLMVELAGGTLVLHDIDESSPLIGIFDLQRLD